MALVLASRLRAESVCVFISARRVLRVSGSIDSFS